MLGLKVSLYFTLYSYVHGGRPPRAQNPEIAAPAPPAGENEMVMPTNGRRIFTEGTFELSIDGRVPQCRPLFRGQLAAANPRFPVLGPPAAYVYPLCILYSLCIPLHLSMDSSHIFKYFFILINLIIFYFNLFCSKLGLKVCLYFTLYSYVYGGPAAQGPKPGNLGSGASSGRE